MTHSQLTRLSRDATVDEAYDVIMRDGGVVIEGLFSDDTIDGFRSDLEPVLAGVDTGHDAVFAGDKTRRAAGLFRRTKHMVTVAMDPLYRGLANKILNRPIQAYIGDDAVPAMSGMHVGVTQAIKIGPGQGAQPLHRDDTVWLWRHPDYQLEARVQIMVAVSDFTAENGGTLVIPGSHRWGDDRAPRLEEAVPTVMKVGSALIWLGSTYHGGGQNTTTSEHRFGLGMGYDLGFLRPEENPFLTYDLDTIRSLPEELQRELDWSSDHFVGWVEVNGQMSDPMELLANQDYVSIDAGPPAPR